MSIKINKLEIENIKRVKAVKVELTESGLTIFGGNNNQGKTSVLDAIAWGLGGEKYRPSNAQREDSVTPPSLNITLSNGLVVERKGKNSELKVIDPSGKKGGQQLLNEFVEQLALDLPKFMQSSSSDKAKTLLRIIGVESALLELEKKYNELYNKRHTIGQIADQKAKFAKEMISHPDAPKDLVSASDLIKQQQDILAKNGENQRKRDSVLMISNKARYLTDQIEEAKKRLADLESQYVVALADLETASKSAIDLQDESTAELEQSITNVEEINRKVRANLDKEKAEEEAKEYGRQYDTLTGSIDEIRKAKKELLDGANLPLPGLSVTDGELTYNGKAWDCMSGSEQLKISTAIVRRLNPNCGFILLDKLEQMDVNTLKEFGLWLEHEGLQAIATRVSTGDECSLIIEDGYVVGNKLQEESKTENAWKAGVF